VSPNEAKWFAEALRRHATETLTPILNLGSSTEDYRTVVCPHIDSVLLKPLRERGVRILHADLKAHEGVDIVGDVSDERIRARIQSEHVRTVFCNNLLEHVDDVPAMCNTIAALCPPNGLLCISVPRDYPYHPDPIDNEFRPSVSELSDIFGAYGFTAVDTAAVDFGSYGQTLIANPRLLMRDAYLLLAGLFRAEKWKVLSGNYSYLLNRYTVSCAVFRRDRMVYPG